MSEEKNCIFQSQGVVNQEIFYFWPYSFLKRIVIIDGHQ